MRCLQCGKEIPEGRKFCSSSCSAKYNNVRRQRRPWTEEQKHEMSVRQLKKLGTKPYEERGFECCCCGKWIKSVRKSKFCSDCLPWKNTLPVLVSLNLWQKGENVEEKISLAKKKLSREYFEDKESLLTLAKKYSICKDTIKSYIGTLRSRSEANRNAIEQKRWEPNNSLQFKSGTHISWEGKKFRFRSSWEEEYMKQLDEQKVSYLYEPFSIRYFDTQRNEERVAIPDFFFPETNTILELKSSFTYDEQNIRDKFQTYRKKGYKAELLLDWEKVEI